MQILRDKIKADKKLVVATNMELTEPEAKGFWPIYDQYQRDLQKINRRIVALLESYAPTSGQVVYGREGGEATKRRLLSSSGSQSQEHLRAEAASAAGDKSCALPADREQDQALSVRARGGAAGAVGEG
jgi:hypothetical protein